jgi:hypothetical protein
MTIKKSKIISKSFGTVNDLNKKLSTATRAGITAEIKLTRGKQLVEHSPMLLIPDPNNPRPGDQIDDAWLKKHLMIGTERSLCKLLSETGEYVIPRFSELGSDLSIDLQDDYEFLRELALSIRNDGLIEPIEIFLADRNNDPEYFINSSLDYGYVVLEGHQRRLSGIMAGVPTVTCIEITDETMLARLKVKHRKLRRQLSENNLRKGLSVGQNFKIVRELLKSEDCLNITVKELSSIIGLNEDIAGALKRLSLAEQDYTKKMINLIENSVVSFKWIRLWINKSHDQIEAEIRRLTSPSSTVVDESKSKTKARGRSGGAIKRSATIKVSREEDSKIFQNYLFQRIPELEQDFLEDSYFISLEKTLNKLMELAKQGNPTRVGSSVT